MVLVLVFICYAKTNFVLRNARYCNIKITFPSDYLWYNYNCICREINEPLYIFRSYTNFHLPQSSVTLSGEKAED